MGSGDGRPLMSAAARFGLMVSTLAGEPLPEPPPLPGRVHRQPWRVPDDEQQLERDLGSSRSSTQCR